MTRFEVLPSVERGLFIVVDFVNSKQPAISEPLPANRAEGMLHFANQADLDGLLVHANVRTGLFVLDRAKLRSKRTSGYIVTDATQERQVAVQSRMVAVSIAESGTIK